MYEETMAEQISTGSTSFKFSKCFSGSTGFIGSTTGSGVTVWEGTDCEDC